MATKNSNGKLKSSLLRLLVVILMLCLSAFTFIACNDNPTDDDDSDYPIVENDVGTISNASFEYGSANLELKDFPQSAPKNWSIIGDNSSRSSAVSSGIVNVTTDGWNSLLNKLYDDDDFLQYCVKKFNIDLEKIKTDNDNDTAKVKEAVVEILKTKFVSPETHDDTAGDKVLMINNYLESKRYGLGTAQKATSSSTVTIEKATNAKITVWVKTQNLVGLGNYGANIRINTSVNSTTTNVFAIYGIRDTEWTQYTFYVRGDGHYSSTITLALGLGFGSNKGTDFVANYTEGTAYFDDITYETVTTVPSTTQYSIDLNDNGDIYVPASTETPVFSLRVNDSIADKKVIDLSDTTIVSHDFHKSNVKQGGEYLTSKTILGAENSKVGEVSLSKNQIYVKNMVNASYAVDIASPDFAVSPEGYAYLTFKVTNELGRLDKHGVTVYVYDYNGNEETVTSIGRAIYSDGKSSQFNIVIKNNFPELDPEGNYPESRLFKLKIVIGATDITSATTVADFSNGGARISEMNIHYGKTYQFERKNYTNNSYEITTTELEDYGTYKFVSSACTDDTVSLYAGNSADFSSTSSTYSINYAPSDIGAIASRPATVNGYEGISSDHVYVTSSSTNANINTNANAGVINTKYLDNYALAGIGEALNHTGKNDIQPLMIYNATASSYGFVGKNLSIAQSAYALVSLKIRVVGNAKASVYLVDTATTDKDVMSISFKNNTDGVKDFTDGEEHNYNLAFENITADMMKTSGADKGWLTLTFYVGTGKTAKNFRLEMWNGSRTGNTNSQGFVFINDITVTTADAFKEPTDWNNLDESVLSSIDTDENAVLYRRPLDQTEIKFNKEQTDATKKVSYAATYVWAKSDSIIYAIYNTIDPVAVDPYASEDNDTEDTETGCTAQTDPSTFWLSFSSIILVVALVFALIMLIVKRALNKRKKSPKVKSAYNVSSRHNKPVEEKVEKVKKDISYDEYEDEVSEEPATEEVEQAPEVEEKATINPEEQTIEEFVYGDVQDFGDYEDNSNKDE